MFDVGFWELALLGVIALIVLGPERLPKVARTAGQMVARVRSYAQGLTSQLEQEASVSGLRDEFRRARDEVNQARDQIESGTRNVMHDAESAAHDVEKSAAANDAGQANKTVARDDGDVQSSADGRAADARERDSIETDSIAAQDADDIEQDVLNIPDDKAEFGEEEPFSLEKTRAEHARRDRESQL